MQFEQNFDSHQNAKGPNNRMLMSVNNYKRHKNFTTVSVRVGYPTYVLECEITNYFLLQCDRREYSRKKQLYVIERLSGGSSAQSPSLNTCN